MKLREMASIRIHIGAILGIRNKYIYLETKHWSQFLRRCEPISQRPSHAAKDGPNLTRYRKIGWALALSHLSASTRGGRQPRCWGQRPQCGHQAPGAPPAWRPPPSSPSSLSSVDQVNSWNLLIFPLIKVMWIQICIEKADPAGKKLPKMCWNRYR